MRTVITEDEQIAANRLRRMLTEVAPDIDVVQVFESVHDTSNFLLNQSDIDLLFLDIHVADGSSFELFNIMEVKSKVIFTTAYDQYAVEAFRQNAVDYLLKPIKREQLAEAIAKAAPVTYPVINNLAPSYKKRIVLRFMSRLYSIKTTDIAYVYSKHKVSYFYTRDGNRYPSDYKLQEVESILDPQQFYRVNRQFIVHIDAIDSMFKHQGARLRITLRPTINETIIISTEKTPLFQKWIER